VTEETRPLDTAIDRPSPEVVKGYLALSLNEPGVETSLKSRGYRLTP